MKIRNGFVSNSSSSSFLIIAKKGQVCSHCNNEGASLAELLRQKYNLQYDRYLRPNSHNFLVEVQDLIDDLTETKNEKLLEKTEKQEKISSFQTLLKKDPETIKAMYPLMWSNMMYVKKIGIEEIKDDINRSLYYFEREISILDDAIGEIDKKIDTLKKYNDGTYNAVQVRVGTDLETHQDIGTLVDKNNAVIIEKELV